jgi:hypothetical protein
MSWTTITQIIVKIYQAEVAPLDFKFDVKSGGLLRTLESVHGHADASNWKGIFLVPDSTGAVRNLLTEHGWVSTADVQSHAKTNIGKIVPNDQNSAQMFTYLSCSLTKESKESLKCQLSHY